MTAILKWEHAADLDHPEDSDGLSRANLYVNGVNVGLFVTPLAAAGWGSVTQDVTANFNSVASTFEFEYVSGNDTYHVKNLRIAVDGLLESYMSYPDGFPFSYDEAQATAPGMNALLGQGFDGAGAATQWSARDKVYVTGSARFTWYYPGDFISPPITGSNVPLRQRQHPGNPERMRQQVR